MKGRKENEEKLKCKIESKLEDAPWYLRDYYKTLIKKTYTTKKTYIDSILLFLKYTQKNMRCDLNDVDIFKNIKPSFISGYINELTELAESTKAARMYAVKSFFDFLVHDEYIASNPFSRGVEMPRDNKEHQITYLTEQEIEIVKNNILNGVGSEFAKKNQKKWRTRDYAIVMMALSLGLRITSLTEIDIDDIDFENQTIQIVEKGNRTRTIFFSAKLKQIIQDWLVDRENLLVFDTTNALFISRERERISSHTIRDMLAKYTYNINKNITPHKLRSTCATSVYNNTGDIYLTADVLGHRNIANTRRYAQVSEDRKKQAAQAMDDILF